MMKINLLKPKHGGHYIYCTIDNMHNGETEWAGWLFNNCHTISYDKRELNGFNEYLFHASRIYPGWGYNYLTDITEA